jgi:hypothetical protein
MVKFTPQEQRLLDVLADGMPHPRRELKGVLYDELAEGYGALSVALTYLRKKLRRKGQDIVCELVRRGIWYRQVILLKSE